MVGCNRLGLTANHIMKESVLIKRPCRRIANEFTIFLSTCICAAAYCRQPTNFIAFKKLKCEFSLCDCYFC